MVDIGAMGGTGLRFACRPHLGIEAQLSRELQCYDGPMSLPFDAKRVREYAVEFGAGGQRLGCEFGLEDGSVVFVDDLQITPEIERIISSLGSALARVSGRDPKRKRDR